MLSLVNRLHSFLTKLLALTEFSCVFSTDCAGLTRQTPPTPVTATLSPANDSDDDESEDDDDDDVLEQLWAAAAANDAKAIKAIGAETEVDINAQNPDGVSLLSAVVDQFGGLLGVCTSFTY